MDDQKSHYAQVWSVFHSDNEQRFKDFGDATTIPYPNVWKCLFFIVLIILLVHMFDQYQGILNLTNQEDSYSSSDAITA